MTPQSISERIRKLAKEILRESTKSLSYSAICREIQNRDSDLNWNTIRGQTYQLFKDRDDIEKTSRGHYRIATPETNSHVETPLANVEPGPSYKEADFYEPFADWLVQDAEDATEAFPLGGNTFGGKWGTPDVIGTRHSKRGDIIPQPDEVLSAEIKTETSQLITAFGQAVSYCLFSHRSYLVVPQQASDEDLARLDSLCQAIGLGLVLFDNTNPQYPDYKFRTRSRKQEPDYFYMNRNMEKIKDKRKLFT